MNLELPQKNREDQPEITLQEASITDIETYIEMEKKVGSKTYFSLTTEKEVLEEMRTGKVYLVKEGNKIVGNISYQTKENGDTYLGGFAIDPEYQGKGIGRKVLKMILDMTKHSHKIELVTHPANIKAITLYLSLGFTISEEKKNYFGDGESRLVLTRIQ